MNETSSNGRGNYLHKPVFLVEAVDGLNIFLAGLMLMQLSGGGHSVEILSRLGLMES